MTLVVEFAGAPGVGKSTLCRAVASDLAASGVDVDDRSIPAGPAARRRRLARKVAVVVAACGRPLRVAWLVRASRRSGLTGRELVARTVNLVVLDATCRRPGPAVVLLDQGITQELASVAVTADHRDLLGALPPGFWPMADVVVRVRVPAAVVADRLRDRGTGESRAERLDAASLVSAIGGVDALLDELLSSPEAGDGLEVWEIDGTDAGLATRLSARIRRSAC